MDFTGKKKFKVSNGSFQSIEIYAVFEIDFDFPKVKERIVEMSTFWTGSPDKNEQLEEHIKYVLPIATNKVYDIARHLWWMSSIKEVDEHLWNQKEGFCYGEYIGIKLIEFHEGEVNADIFEVEEIEG